MQNRFSNVHIIFVFLFLSIFIYILNSKPASIGFKDITKGELVEYSDYEPHPSKKREKEEQSILENINEYVTEIEIEAKKQIKPKKATSTLEYKELLDDLLENSSKSVLYAKIITNKLLQYKSYPKDIVKINLINLDQNRANVQGNFIVANFNIVDGTLNIDENSLYKLDTKIIIAIIVHELDHFDKIASICRYMGVDNFEKLLNQNNIYNVNKTFWRIASAFAETKNFDGEYYTQALERFISLGELEEKGVYTEFYRIAEELRNPLEISAYNASDYVYSHYGIANQEGPTQKLVNKFNNIDWGIYNFVQNNKTIANERMAIFDYLFLLGILKEMPEMQEILNTCMNKREGNLNLFWRIFKSKIINFTDSSKQINTNDYNKLINLLTIVENKIQNGITTEEISKALELKINTLRKESLNEKSIEELKSSIKTYIKFSKENNIENKEQELKNTLTLIAIENKLYTNNYNSNFSLYNIEMPNILIEMNNIRNKKQRFLSIYNNPAFYSIKPINQTEEEFLIKLINENRINIK